MPCVTSSGRPRSTADGVLVCKLAAEGLYSPDPAAAARRERWARRAKPRRSLTVGADRHTQLMATITAVAIQRSGPAIRAALAEHGIAGQMDRFEVEMRAALARAVDDLDLACVDRVLGRWHALATMAANPLSDDEQAEVARAKVGDLAGLRARDEHGNWITL